MINSLDASNVDVVEKFKSLQVYRNVKIKLSEYEAKQIKPYIYNILGLVDDNSDTDFNEVHRYRNNGILLMTQKTTKSIAVPIGEIYHFSPTSLFFRCANYGTDDIKCLEIMNDLFKTNLGMDKNHMHTQTIRASDHNIKPLYVRKKTSHFIVKCPKCGEEFYVAYR